jgi:hypothetical protein
MRSAPSLPTLRRIYRHADAQLGEWIDLANDIRAAYVARRAELAASRYRGDLHGITRAAPHQYIVFGSVRGLVSSHRTIAAAERALERDQRGCRAQGGYSDATVYEYRDGGWSVSEIGGGA